MEYDFKEHKHRFAAWAAARAVNRGFAKTIDIVNAIDCAKLKEFSESSASITQQEYDNKQKEWCDLIIEHFSKLDKQQPKNPTDPIQKYECSYGRASKIVAIYLKTSYIIPNKGETENCEVIHPPIDSILLKNLAHLKSIKELSNLKWTNFDKRTYREIVKIIKNNDLPFNWRLEEYWDLI